MTRWLDEDEQRAWLRLAGVMLKLSPALDSQLQRDSDLTHFEYLCLAMLSECEGRTLQMSELAARANASLSRLSHVVTKLEQRGWVARTPSPHSRRVTLVSLTEEGWDVLVEGGARATSRRWPRWSSTTSLRRTSPRSSASPATSSSASRHRGCAPRRETTATEVIKFIDNLYNRDA